jgi:hypothetical protein
VAVFVTNAITTSRRTGPGALRLPPEEAGALVALRLAVYGDQPPAGFTGRGLSN